MSRDFVGALLQLNAEKQVSREQLIGAVEDGIQSAYRRVAGDEDIVLFCHSEESGELVFDFRERNAFHCSSPNWPSQSTTSSFVTTAKTQTFAPSTS